MQASLPSLNDAASSIHVFDAEKPPSTLLPCLEKSQLKKLLSSVC